MYTTKMPPGFRSSARKQAASAGGGGFSGRWDERIDIAKDRQTQLLLLRRSYPGLDADGSPCERPFYVHTEHTIKRNGLFRTIECGGASCAACAAQEDGDASVQRSAKHAMDVIELGLFQRVPQVDGKGNVKKDAKGNPYMGLSPVTGRGDFQKASRSFGPDGLSKDYVVGRGGYIDVGRNHINNLSEAAPRADGICRCGGNLTPSLFTCGNKVCGELIADCVADNLTDKAIQEYLEEPVKCGSCKTIGMCTVLWECSNGCAAPGPVGIYGVVISCRKTGEGASTVITVETVTPVTSFKLANGRTAATGWKEENGVWSPVLDPIVAKLARTYDFKKTFAYSAERASELLGTPRPQTYGRPPGREPARPPGDRHAEERGWVEGSDDDDDPIPF